MTWLRRICAQGFYFAGAFIANRTWISRRIIRNLKADWLDNFCKNCPKTFLSLGGQKQILRGLVLILPYSRSELDLLVAAANSTFCRWRRHEFTTRFGDQYFRLVKKPSNSRLAFLTEHSHGTIVCLLPPVFLPPNFDWVFLTVVIFVKVTEACNT